MFKKHSFSVQRANRYIVAFRIMILYDIYLSVGNGQATQTVGALVLYWAQIHKHCLTIYPKICPKIILRQKL